MSIHSIMAVLFRARFINVKGYSLTLPGPNNTLFFILTDSASSTMINSKGPNTESLEVILLEQGNHH